jgi:hypothetical protein
MIDRKRCNNCGKTKPLAAFYRQAPPRSRDGFRARCKVCDRIWLAQYRQTEKYEKWWSGYRRRPDVVAREEKRNKARYPVINARAAALLKTPKGKLIQARSQARWRLARADRPKTKARLLATIAACTAEIREINLRQGTIEKGRLPRADRRPA